MKCTKILLLTILLSVSAHALATESLTVAVAANVKYAFDDLAEAFTKETGIEVKPVFNSSGKIVAQVKEGAPYDVFLSADMEYPEKLFKDGQAVSEPKIYAYGKLVLWTLRDDLDLSKGLLVLAEPSVKKVALANPKLAPYGAEALKALDKIGLRAAVEARLVFAENIAQVVQYVDSRNVDAGFTAKSLVTAPELGGRGKWIDVPQDAYDPIAQGSVVLRHGRAIHAEAASRFHGFLFSPTARAIFQKYGYTLP